MKSQKIVVIDYGAGNLRSVAKALESLGHSPIVSNDPKMVQKAHTLILPGVGACDTAMACLNNLGLSEAVQRFIQSGKPFLGVCLGLQLLFQLSEEGNAPCLGVFEGKVRRLPPGLKVPHMGWNQVHWSKEHPALKDIPQDSYFYFVHSYYADPRDKDIVAATTNYGIDFCSAIARDNLVATQFHPEKSGTLGLKLYDSFLKFAIGQKTGG